MSGRERLRRRARALRSKMRKLGPMLKRSAVFRNMKCGKPTCECIRGELHFFLCVTYKEKGKTKTVYVDKNRHGEVLIYSANYKKFKVLLQEHSQILLSLLKSQGRTKPR